MSLELLRDFHGAHKKVDWGTVYKDAKTLEIGVFYYRSLPADHFEELKTFFHNGGHLRLIVADPDRPELLSIVGTHFFRGASPATLANKIRESIDLYRKAFRESGTHKGKIDVFVFQGLFHYTYTLVNRRFLYLSPYAQFEEIPQLLSPVTVIDIDADRRLRDYWDDQLKNFAQNSKRYPEHGLTR